MNKLEAIEIIEQNKIQVSRIWQLYEFLLYHVLNKKSHGYPQRC